MESTEQRRSRSRLSSLSDRAFAYQLGLGMMAIAVLLAGIASGLYIGADDLFDSFRRSGSATLPLAVALGISLGLVVLGAIATRRQLRPAADIEGQLHALLSLPVVSPEDVSPTGGATALAAGWNRLVHSLQSADRMQSLNDRLENAVLEYRQRRGEQVLDALTDGIAVTDDAQRIISANNALYSILHMDAESETLPGESVGESLARKTGKEAIESLLDSKSHGRRVVVEFECPDGDSDCVLRVCRTPFGAGGNSGQGSSVWSIRDITQQKMADRMRDQFVNAATHELRTPMANIKAYAETLALGEVEDVEQQKTFCNVINDEVTRLARFIDDLLHLSRMEVGATTLQLQVTEMGRLLEETAKKVLPQLKEKDLQFEVEMPGKLPELIVDKDKLAVAIINLLGNAAKYTPNGGSVHMRVSMPEDSLQIDVEDTGIGIAEEEIPKVLEKFYRSADPRVYSETGSGLGLSLTHEIIRLHGGKLTVSSELNKGSKFTITLPVTAG